MLNSAPVRLHAAIHRLHTYAELVFYYRYACCDLPAHSLPFFAAIEHCCAQLVPVPSCYFMTPLVAVQASHASR